MHFFQCGISYATIIIIVNIAWKIYGKKFIILNIMTVVCIYVRTCIWWNYNMLPYFNSVPLYLCDIGRTNYKKFSMKFYSKFSLQRYIGNEGIIHKGLVRSLQCSTHDTRASDRARLTRALSWSCRNKNIFATSQLYANRISVTSKVNYKRQRNREPGY